MVIGYPRPKRIDILSNLDRKNAGRKHRIAFQGVHQDIRVFRVPLELPKYRLANGRTKAAQRQHIAEHPNIGSDFFSRDVESDEAQKAQHILLEQTVDEQKLLGYFKKHKQIEPLILTYDGFVVNGNRRICAMRILYDESPEDYMHFSHVDIILLPRATEKELDELEAQLQVHPDIKSQYTWVSKAIMMRDRREDHRYSEKELSSLYDLRVSEVRMLLDMLDYSDKYLASRGREHHYTEIVDDEFAFRQLVKTRKKMKIEQRKNLLEICSFALIEEPIGGRVYQVIPLVGEYIDKIQEALIPELHAKTYEDNVGDSIEELLGVDVTTEQIDVISKASDLKNQNIVRTVTQEVIEGEEALKKEKKKANYVLSLVKKAHTNLTEALIGTTSERAAIKGIAVQLNEIERLIAKLRSWLLDHDPD